MSKFNNTNPQVNQPRSRPPETSNIGVHGDTFFHISYLEVALLLDCLDYSKVNLKPEVKALVERLDSKIFEYCKPLLENCIQTPVYRTYPKLVRHEFIPKTSGLE